MLAKTGMNLPIMTAPLANGKKRRNRFVDMPNKSGWNDKALI